MTDHNMDHDAILASMHETARNLPIALEGEAPEATLDARRQIVLLAGVPAMTADVVRRIVAHEELHLAPVVCLDMETFGKASTTIHSTLSLDREAVPAVFSEPGWPGDLVIIDEPQVVAAAPAPQNGFDYRTANRAPRSQRRKRR